MASRMLRKRCREMRVACHDPRFGLRNRGRASGPYQTRTRLTLMCRSLQLLGCKPVWEIFVTGLFANVLRVVRILACELQT